MRAGPDGGSLQLLLTRELCRLPPLEVLRAAVSGGVDVVQIREKGKTTAALVAWGRQVHAELEPHGVPLLINDDVVAAAALAGRVAGVHLGQEDLSVEAARRALGPDAWIGLSTHGSADVRAAELTSATHYGLGAWFGSATKPGAQVVARVELVAALRVATRPLFAIGGITPANVGELVALGVQRVAVSSALLASSDPGAVAAALKAALRPVA